VLGRGYAVCWDADRDVILRDAAAVEAGVRLRVTLARGELEARVTASRPPGD
jgi:exonuclease VII large subunit